MRGITPVITTVLLLLAAVAAVGGSWVWYQRMQTSAQSGGQAGVDKITSTSSIQYTFVDRTYIDSGDLKIEFGNQGSDIVNITTVQAKKFDGSYADCTTTAFTIASNSLHTTTCSGAVGTAVGNIISIKTYFNNGAIKEFSATVES